MKVGLIVYGGEGWLGGRNYFRNLLRAVMHQADRTIEPVVLTGHQNSDSFSDCPQIEIIRSRLFDSGFMLRYARKSITLLSRRDLLVEQLLGKNRISVLSHSGHLGSRALLPTTGWIPDFQTIHLPQFTSPKERKQRMRRLRELCENCTKVILSSENARNDFDRFAPAYATKAEILRFVATPIPREATTTLPELREKYGFERDYFLLPNQFWAHKNHRTVITALMNLKKRAKTQFVIATGSASDSRNPGYFQSLLAYARECDVMDCFRVLGIVPYADLAGLMRSSIALINPSLFEGWSTSVEESKSVGKRIVLSDIPVHREQDPEGGIYFPALDAEALAESLLRARDLSDHQGDLAREERALASFPIREREFACRFEQIVLTAAGVGNPKR